MKATQQFICAAILSVVFAQSANAADTTPKSAVNMSSSSKEDKTIGGESHLWTLERARKNAHDYADKLDKMTSQEWDDMQKKREKSLRKWTRMTPQEKDSQTRMRSSKGQAQQ